MLTYRHQLIYKWTRSRDVDGKNSQPITKDNVRDVASIRSDLVADNFERFLYQGRRGVFAVHEGKVVGHGWASDWVSESRTFSGYFRLPENSVLIHYCFVSPEHRGRGLYQQILRSLVQACSGAPGSILVDTNSNNKASQNGILKSGFSRNGHGHYIQVGRHLVWRNQTLTP